jgi:hypothetical protein
MHWEYHTGDESNGLEGQTDQRVYELYGLTPEEVAMVEGKA